MISDFKGNQYETEREMCEAYGICVSTYSNRITQYGWTQEKALTVPVKKFEKGKTLRQYCIENNREKIIVQFDEEKNKPITVDTVSAKSDKKCWFTYDCGHTVLQRVADKTSGSLGCPHCLNRGAVGKSIADVYPETYALMFMEEKNQIKASEVPFHSGKVFWWKCQTCGEEFEAKPSMVTTGKRRCKCCNKKRSGTEDILEYYLKRIDPDIAINYQIDGLKYDVFLPEYNLIVEYDGYPWHNSKISRTNDIRKDEIAIRKGYKICRLRDRRLKENDELKAMLWIFDYDYEYRYFSKLPEFLRGIIGDGALKLDIDVDRDAAEIKNFSVKRDKDQSLLAAKPELRDYLDPDDDRNGDPAFVFTKTRKITFHLRHPEYKNLRWMMSAHELFRTKDFMPRSIRMCVKLIDKFPDLEKEVSKIGKNMCEKTLIKKNCDHCGEEMELEYTQLYYTKRCKKFCRDCRKWYKSEKT